MIVVAQLPWGRRRAPSKENHASEPTQRVGDGEPLPRHTQRLNLDGGVEPNESGGVENLWEGFDMACLEVIVWGGSEVPSPISDSHPSLLSA